MRILITGRNSYIGRRFTAYATEHKTAQVDAVSVRNSDWKQMDFGCYDVLLHLAAVVHQAETKETIPLYDTVNYALTLQLAEKAKREGVCQFIFLSSVSVYGMEEGIVTKKTPLSPATHYGCSKLKAEEALRKLHDSQFTVTILRAPMVYGENCPGNYGALERMAAKMPVIPRYQNARSLISIEHLTEFIQRLMDERAGGIYLPQDPDYFCTCDRIAALAEQRGRKVYRTRVLNPVIALARRWTGKGKKAFGNWIYAEDDPCIERF